jgi:hypothetical protein
MKINFLYLGSKLEVNIPKFSARDDANGSRQKWLVRVANVYTKLLDPAMVSPIIYDTIKDPSNEIKQLYKSQSASEFINIVEDHFRSLLSPQDAFYQVCLSLWYHVFHVILVRRYPLLGSPTLHLIIEKGVSCALWEWCRIHQHHLKFT